MDSYTWTEYDPREGGVQVIKDSNNNVQITTEFLKVPGGDHGGSWAVRVKGEPVDKGKRYDPYPSQSIGFTISSRENIPCIDGILLWPGGSWRTRFGDRSRPRRSCSIRSFAALVYFSSRIGDRRRTSSLWIFSRFERVHHYCCRR